MDPSKILHKLSHKARALVENPKALERLFDASKSKFDKIELPSFKELKKDFDTARELLLSYINGSYKTVPWKSVLAIVAAMIYFINPFDLIPDIIPLKGLIDDASVFVFVFASIREDLDKYQKSSKP